MDELENQLYDTIDVLFSNNAKFIRNKDNTFCLVNKKDSQKLTSDYTLDYFVFYAFKNWYSIRNLLPKEMYEEKYINNGVGNAICKLGYIPYEFQENEYLFNYCYKNDMYEYLFQFTSLKLQNKISELLDKNTLDETTTRIFSNWEKGRRIYGHSILLFKECIESKKYELIPDFYSIDDDTKALFKREISGLIFPDEFIEKVVESRRIPYILRDNNQVFKKLIDNKKYNLLLKNMDSPLISKEILYQIEDDALEILEWSDIKDRYSKSIDMFEFLIEHWVEFYEDEYTEDNKFDIECFDVSVIVSELDKYGEEIIKILQLNNLTKEKKYSSSGEFIEKLYSNKKFFEYALDKKNTQLLLNFDINLYTENIINKYSDVVYDVFKNSFEIPKKLQGSKAFFKICIEKDNFFLAFSSKTLGKEEFIKYYSLIIKYGEILRQNNILHKFNYRDSDILLEIVLNNKNYQCLDYFFASTFNSDNIVPYYQELVDNLGVELYNCENLLYSSKFFKFCLDNNYIEIINNIGYTEQIEKIIQDNFEKVTKICDVSIPENFLGSPSLLKYFIKQDKKDVVLKFRYGAINKLGYSEEDNQYLNYLANISIDELTIEFSASSRLFRYYMEKDDFTHINEFKSYAFGNRYYSGLKISYLFEETKQELDYFNSVLPKIMEKMKNKLPEGMIDVDSVFEYCVKNNVLKFLAQFSESVYQFSLNSTNVDSVVKAIYEYSDSIVPLALISNDTLLKYAIKNNKKELLEQISFNVGILKDGDGYLELTDKNNELSELKDIETLKIYEQVLSITKEEIYSKLKKYSEKNDEVLNTILPFMLAKRMDCFREKDMEKIIIYPDLQQKLYRLDDHTLGIIAKIMPMLDSDVYDLTGVLVKVLNNMNTYKSLFDSININNITDDELKKFILVVQKDKNLYNINNIDNLNNLDNEIKKYYFGIDKKIKDNNISLDELKEAILERKFGLSMSDTSFIVARYCHDMEMLKNSKLDRKIYNILNSINLIYTSNSIDTLKYLYITSKRTVTDFYTVVALEASIRKEYAKMYNDTLYKLKEEHKLDNNHELYKSNKKVYDLISNSTYNNIHPDIYIMDDNFNLQIHALGAYRKWDVPDNFKDDWERPKIAYHGICTSYIGNNQIANARAIHPIYGFSSYEESALLCAGNYDLCSDYVIKNYDTGYSEPYAMYPPKEMIDNTRHTHNEIVIERRSLKGTNFKRKPDYVVYLVDDINNEDNFKEDNQLYKEILQASVDWNIPIVVVDRLKYAKREKAKCDNLLSEFYDTKNYKILEEIVLNYCNNMIGCKVYDNDVKAYNQVFSSAGFANYIDNILEYIENKFTLDEQIMSYKSLITAVDNEHKKSEKFVQGNNILSSSYLKERLKKIYPEYTDEETIEIKQNSENIEIRNYITEYYYSQTEDVRQQITIDINNNLSYEQILFKINNNEYGGENYERTNSGFKK